MVIDLLDQQSLGNFMPVATVKMGSRIGARARRSVRRDDDAAVDDPRWGWRSSTTRSSETGRTAWRSVIPNLTRPARESTSRSFQGTPREFRIDRNTIQAERWRRDRAEQHRRHDAASPAVGNFIDLNGGRGVDLLNQAGGSNNFDAEAYVRFGDKSTTLVNGVAVSNRNVDHRQRPRRCVRRQHSDHCSDTGRQF